MVLHAAHLLDVGTGRVVSPGEVLVEGERITAVGAGRGASRRRANH